MAKSDKAENTTRNAAGNTAVRKYHKPAVVLVLVASLVIAAFMLYPGARDAYIARRSNDCLLVEKEALEDRYNWLNEQIEILKTDEGIEDRAREEFGWVLDGERAVDVTGLGIGDGPKEEPPAIESGSVKAPEDWWTKTLDTFFGVTEPEPAAPTEDAIPGLADAIPGLSEEKDASGAINAAK